MDDLPPTLPTRQESPLVDADCQKGISEMKEKAEVLQIRLPVSTMAKVRKMAKKRKTSISEIGRRAVGDYLVTPVQMLTPDTIKEMSRIFLKVINEND